MFLVRYLDRGMEGVFRPWSLLANLLSSAEGSEIVELAISLPLLLVFLVGILDFGTAFTLKEKIGNAVFEAARFASNQPSSDLSFGSGACGTSSPGSICAIRDVVENNLLAAKVDDCGLATATPAFSSPLTWTFTASSCSSGIGTMTMIIERGYTYSGTLTSTGPYTIEASKVTISYPYNWRFYKAIRLVAPSANYASSSQITAVAVMQNLN